MLDETTIKYYVELFDLDIIVSLKGTTDYISASGTG